MKLCSFCKETKPKEEFSQNIAMEDGLSLECRQCVKLRHAMTRQPILPRRCLLPSCNVLFTPKRQKTRHCKLSHYQAWKRIYDQGKFEELRISVDRRKEHVGYEYGDSVCVVI